jgi:hypothetical protein
MWVHVLRLPRSRARRRTTTSLTAATRSTSPLTLMLTLNALSPASYLKSRSVRSAPCSRVRLCSSKLSHSRHGVLPTPPKPGLPSSRSGSAAAPPLRSMSRSSRPRPRRRSRRRCAGKISACRLGSMSRAECCVHRKRRQASILEPMRGGRAEACATSRQRMATPPSKS